MAHIAPRRIEDQRSFLSPISKTIEQMKITNEDFEGIFRGFQGDEAAVTAAIGGVAGIALLNVETESRLINVGAKVLGGVALYLGFKASERTAEVSVENARKAFRGAIIATVS